MASGYYNSFYTNLLKGEFNFHTGGDTFKVALLTSGYSFDETAKDTHQAYDDLTNEVVGTGYTAGGATISNTVVVESSALNKAYVDGDDPSWPSSTITARGASVYKDSGVPSTSWLVRYIDFGSDQSTSGTEFKLAWSASGVIDLTGA